METKTKANKKEHSRAHTNRQREHICRIHISMDHCLNLFGG